MDWEFSACDRICAGSRGTVTAYCFLIANGVPLEPRQRPVVVVLFEGPRCKGPCCFGISLEFFLQDREEGKNQEIQSQNPVDLKRSARSIKPSMWRPCAITLPFPVVLPSSFLAWLWAAIHENLLQERLNRIEWLHSRLSRALIVTLDGIPNIWGKITFPPVMAPLAPQLPQVWILHLEETLV